MMTTFTPLHILCTGICSPVGFSYLVDDNLADRLGKLTNGNKPIPEGSNISKDQAIDSAYKSVKDTFPESGCSEKCIKAQLQDYYGKLNCTPKNVSGVPRASRRGINSKADEFCFLPFCLLSLRNVNKFKARVDFAVIPLPEGVAFAVGK